MGLTRFVRYAALIAALAGCSKEEPKRAPTRDPLLEMMQEDAARNAQRAAQDAEIDRQARAEAARYYGRQDNQTDRTFLLEHRIDRLEDDLAIEQMRARANGKQP